LKSLLERSQKVPRESHARGGNRLGVCERADGTDRHLDTHACALRELGLNKVASSLCGFLRALVGQELCIARREVIGLCTSKQSKDIERILVALTVGSLALADLVDLRDQQRCGARDPPRPEPGTTSSRSA
jgi:hypothetical protein